MYSGFARAIDKSISQWRLNECLFGPLLSTFQGIGTDADTEVTAQHNKVESSECPTCFSPARSPSVFRCAEQPIPWVKKWEAHEQSGTYQKIYSTMCDGVLRVRYTINRAWSQNCSPVQETGQWERRRRRRRRRRRKKDSEWQYEQRRLKSRPTQQRQSEMNEWRRRGRKKASTREKLGWLECAGRKWVKE